MQKIRFTYTSTEIEPSVFLLLYFRMVGIYVYERFFDSSDEYQRELLQVLDEGIGREPMIWDDYDLDLYYVQSNDELELVKSFCEKEVTSKKLFILSNSMLSDVGDTLWPNIEYTLTDNFFLSSLLRQIQALGIIDNLMLNQLIACGTIYCANNIWQLTLSSKYFYAAENDESFQKFKGKYKHIVTQLLNQLDAMKSSWYKEDSYYIQYSILNIAYEGNQYCGRSRESMWYDSKELADICKVLLENTHIYETMSDSLYLLLAQIYSDLLKDSNAAYRYFNLACEEFNAYAYFKMGSYWQDYARDYDRAIRYYSRSVAIYPEYYRAWYRMGNCYMETAKCNKALSVFNNVVKILQPRRDKGTIRPMEIEYLFKAHNQCGFVWNKIFRDRMKSLVENYEAVETWDAIESSKFFDRILGEVDKEGPIRKRTQSEINVNKIYYEISKLNDKMTAAQA